MTDPWERVFGIVVAIVGLVTVIASQVADFRSEEVYGWTDRMIYIVTGMPGLSTT